jgi:S1-C subfamily serine protease
MLIGDVLAAWNGTPLGSVREMLARLEPESIGTEVALDLIRGGQPMRLAVRIGERAAA